MNHMLAPALSLAENRLRSFGQILWFPISSTTQKHKILSYLLLKH